MKNDGSAIYVGVLGHLVYTDDNAVTSVLCGVSGAISFINVNRSNEFYLKFVKINFLNDDVQKMLRKYRLDASIEFIN